MAATTGEEILNKIKTRMQELEMQEVSTKEQLREVEEAVAADPNDVVNVSLLTLRDTYKDIYEMAQEAVMQTAVTSGPPI